jgi:hypothetical protein
MLIAQRFVFHGYFQARRMGRALAKPIIVANEADDGRGQLRCAITEIPAPSGIKDMICRESRDCLALALRRYVAGRISNDDLDRVRVDRRDRGAVAVRRMAWGLYSDTKRHHATGRYAINRDAKRIVVRSIVFLHPDREYLWPDYSPVQIYNWPLNLLTFGWWERRKKVRREEFERAGNFGVWPFVATTDFEDAIRRPRYLAGCRRW